MRIFLAIAAILAMAGCAASRNAHYAAQSEYRNSIAAQNAAKLAAVQSNAASCSDDTCRVAVAAFAALVQSERVERPVQYQSQATSVLGLVERALSVGAAVYGQKIQGDSLVDLAGVVASSAGDRSIRIDQSNHSNNSINDSQNDSSDHSVTGDTGSHNSDDDIAIEGSFNTPTEIDVSGDGSAVGDGNDIDNSTVIDQSDPGDDCSDESCNPAEVIDP